MKKTSFSRRASLISFIALIFLLGMFCLVYAGQVKRAGRLKALADAKRTAESIQDVIRSYSKRTKILEAWLDIEGSEAMQMISRDEKGESYLRAFNKIAASIYEPDQMYSVLMLPGGVIRYIFPQAGNTSLLGTDAFDEPYQETLLKKSEETGASVICGPHYVKHIGMTLYFYEPVDDLKGKFWGFTAIAVRIPDAIRHIALDRLTDLGYSYELSYETDSGFQRICGTFTGQDSAVVNKFLIQDTTWSIALEPEGGWLGRTTVIAAFLFCPLLAVLISLMVGYFKGRRDVAIASLQSDARHDAMTGLLNHEAVIEEIDSELTRIRGGVLFIIDIDNFKQVNDTAGHQAGDQVLIDVAHALNTSFRSNDIIGRYGGDEFAVYMIGSMSVPDFSVKAADFQSKLRRIQIAGTGRYITCSIGVARRTEKAGTMQNLFRCADQALYASKRSGKNRYTVYEDDSNPIIGEDEGEESMRGNHRGRKRDDFVLRE